MRKYYTALAALIVALEFTSVIFFSIAPTKAQTVIAPPTPQFTRSLSDQVGFSDQTLDELQEKGFDTVDSNIAFNAYNHNYKLFSIIGRISPNPIPADGVVVLYQLDLPVPKILWKWNTGSSKVFFGDKNTETSNWPPAGDWLKNGSFFFGIYTVRDSTSWAATLLHIFEFHEDQTVTSNLKDIIPLGHILKSVQVEDSGQLLFSLSDIRGEGSMGISICCGPRMNRYFEYDGINLTDLSAKYIDEYDATLGSLLYSLTTWKVDNITGQEANLFAKNLLEILMIYEIAGYRQEGWALVQSLVAQAKASGRLAENTYVDSTFMPAMSQLIREGKSFIEPDYIGHNALIIPNYYLGD